MRNLKFIGDKIRVVNREVPREDFFQLFFLFFFFLWKNNFDQFINRERVTCGASRCEVSHRLLNVYVLYQSSCLRVGTTTTTLADMHVEKCERKFIVFGIVFAYSTYSRVSLGLNKFRKGKT